MRRSQLLTPALVAVVATAAAVSASAFAAELPQILPTSATTRTWTGESEGSAEFNSETAEAGVTLTITCEKAPTEGTEEAGKPLGAFHIHFLGCKSTIGGVTVKCTDLNHTTPGEVLALGTWHLVFDRKKGGVFTELTTAVLFLLELTHLSCSSLVLDELKGELLCLDLKATEKSKTHSFHCIAEGPKQTEEWCKKDVSGTCTEPVVPKLESNTSHSLFRSAAWQALGNDTYTEEIFADI
jgi:hypothetical protein